METKTENKKAFLMYYEYEEQLEDLTDEELGQLVRHIYKYEKLGLEPENLGFLMKMAFNFIKGNLNRDREKYDKRAETSAINGKKGGRPRRNKPNEKPNEKPKKPNKADIDIVIDNDIDIDIKNVNDIDNGNDNFELSSTLFDLIESNFGRTLSPIEYEEISTWKDNEITRHAIKEAVLKGKCGIKYISRILESYQKQNITTVQQAKQNEEDPPAEGACN